MTRRRTPAEVAVETAARRYDRAHAEMTAARAALDRAIDNKKARP